MLYNFVLLRDFFVLLSGKKNIHNGHKAETSMTLDVDEAL